jgi:hypothetical protein
MDNQDIAMTGSNQITNLGIVLNSKRYYLYKLGVLIVFLDSLRVWFTWDINTIFVGLFGIFASSLLLLKSRYFFNFSASNILIFILYALLKIYSVKDGNPNAFVGAAVSIGFFYFIIFLKDKFKIDLFLFLTKAMAIIVFISFIAWILFQVGVEFPYSIGHYNQYVFKNFYVFLYNPGNFFILPRFNGVFLEPGHLGMILAFLLIANQFDFKRKEIWAIIIVLFFTFSLAAYILVVVGVSAYLVVRSRQPVMYFFLWVILIAVIYVFFTNLNNGDNVVNNYILERLRFDGEDISGNNRFSNGMNSYYERFIESSNRWWGVGIKDYSNINWDSGNAGYKVFAVTHGLIGLILIALFYILLVLSNKTVSSLILITVYTLSFLQASYALWACELIIFITAMPYFKQLEKQNEKKKNIIRHI